VAINSRHVLKRPALSPVKMYDNGFAVDCSSLYSKAKGGAQLEIGSLSGAGAAGFPPSSGSPRQLASPSWGSIALARRRAQAFVRRNRSTGSRSGLSPSPRSLSTRGRGDITCFCPSDSIDHQPQQQDHSNQCQSRGPSACARFRPPAGGHVADDVGQDGGEVLHGCLSLAWIDPLTWNF